MLVARLSVEAIAVPRIEAGLVEELSVESGKISATAVRALLGIETAMAGMSSSQKQATYLHERDRFATGALLYPDHHWVRSLTSECLRLRSRRHSVPSRDTETATLTRSYPFLPQHSSPPSARRPHPMRSRLQTTAGHHRRAR